jgi:hypothetical protein
MKSSRDNKTTAQNLEERFDRGENVLDYFDLSKARVVHPQSKNAAKKIGLFGKGRFASACDGSREISALSEEEIAKSFR